MDRSTLDLLWATARRQRGLLTIAHVDHLVGPLGRRALVRSGRLSTVTRGVYRTAGAPVDAHARILAACLVYGPRAVASHASAMWLWGLDEGRNPRAIEVTRPVTTHRAPRHRRGLTLHQTTTWGSGHRSIVDGIPVTSVARTLCDLSNLHPAPEVRRAMDVAFAQRLVTLEQVQAISNELAGPGRRRSVVTAIALEAHLPERAECESVPQIDLLRAIVEAGFPTPTVEHPVTIDGQPYRIDLSYPEHKIALEYDGFPGHSALIPFTRDRARQNALEGDGWSVLRYTKYLDIDPLLLALGKLLSRAA
jgi:hypothetical protein